MRLYEHFVTPDDKRTSIVHEHDNCTLFLEFRPFYLRTHTNAIDQSAKSLKIFGFQVQLNVIRFFIVAEAKHPKINSLEKPHQQSAIFDTPIGIDKV